LVGRTSASGVDTDGHVLFGNGVSYQSNTDNAAQFVNRNGTDGSITSFYKNGSSVGSIATTSGRLSIGSNDVGLFFDSTNERFTPIHQTNQADRDGAIDLGYASSRFKDLYLSNAVKNSSGALAVESGGGGQLLLKASSELTFTSNTAERGRFDTSGNFLVGNTASDFGSVGAKLSNLGEVQGTVSGATVAAFNRKSSSGEITSFWLDTVQKGNISVSAYGMGFGGGTRSSDFFIKTDGTASFASGVNLGVGTSSVSAKITLADHTTAAGGIKFRTASSSVSLWSSGSGNLNSDASFNTTGRFRVVGGNAASDPDINFTGAASGTGFSRATNDITFITSASEAARIDASQNLLVGTTGANTYSSTVNTGVQIAPDFIGVARNQNTVMHLNRQGNDGTIVDFRTFGFVRGSVSISGSTTSYNTSSDERLKDNIIDAPIASEDIDAIQVRSFDWKADGEHQKYGMVAQELLEVAPDAVTQGDTPDDMMGVDYSKLVPMLIKEIQSLRQRVAQLEE